MNLTCPNCNTEVKGNFCHHCGQKNDLGRITVKQTFQELLSSTFSLEGPLLRTLKYMVINPGKVFREYIEGKRKTYYKPASFFILFSAIYLIVRALIGYDPISLTTPHDPSKEYTTSMQAGRFMVKNINYILFFLIFTIGATLKLLFWRKYNLAEYLTIGLYITGMYVLISTFAMFPYHYLQVRSSSVQFLIWVVFLFYNAQSIFVKKTFWRFLGAFLTSIISISLYVILGFGLSLIIVRLKQG